jgi:4-diphosphocytidyl-2-C-methyl-D-erythritol kinase
MLSQTETQTELPAQSWPAPAKLNLFLRVLGRRPDGYHELQTLFQILDWGDELLITVNDSGEITRGGACDVIPQSGDICIRAAYLLQALCGVTHGAHIDLKKNIPVGAGLGGGSSDAATVLVALNQLWRCGMSRQQLAEAGLQLGADVPVFVHGHSAWARGRGERLQPVMLGPGHYVLVFPPFGISTAEVFQYAGLKRDSQPLEMTKTSMQPGRNDCAAAALELYPELGKTMRALEVCGRPYVSGTGSTIFLPFDSKKSAINTASKLKCRYNVRAVGGVDRSPLLKRLSVGG